MSSKTAETCKFCKKVVVIDPVKEDVDGVYMIANCDSCNAMTCRECLTTDIEGQCKGCYTPEDTFKCSVCYERWDNIDGVDCYFCGLPVCDDCMYSPDPDTMIDRCITCGDLVKK